MVDEKRLKKTIALLAVFVLIGYFLYQPEPRKSIFTETLGDMTLVRYETGEAAAMQISDIYGLKDIPIAKAYSAVYVGSNGSMHVWVVETENHNIAYDAFKVMNSKLGALEGHEYSGDVGQTESHRNEVNMMGNFTNPVRVDIFDFQKPEVYFMRVNNLYHYYYLKMNYKIGRIYWITFDYPDIGYQKAMVKQAIMKI